MSRQRDFLDLLPLLFHCNHPGLPGYVSAETPAGIADFQPSRRALSVALKLSKSFEYKKRARSDFPIEALFLMGSVGSVAYSGKSDLDLWLCHRSDLDADSLAALRQKAVLVEQWAADLGLEAHIFFIDPQRFRLGEGTPISTESCGNIQHHLLLEEFYRTSLWLAGLAPAWWLVPPHSEYRYTDYLRHLLDNRFVNPADVIDLGGLEQIRPDEFLGGTLWHLHKAIRSPHKSLLKLLLMESYDAEFPAPLWLCTELKARLYAGERVPEQLDSYVLMYRKVERHLLERDEPDRLELARQSFYLKVSEPLASGQAAGPEKQRRRELLQAIIAAWGWNADRLADLDGRRHWTIGRALQEQKQIERELTRAYQGVRRFAREHAAMAGLAKEEIRLLGRRLAAALERKPGKVERLNLHRSDRIETENFALQEMLLGDSGSGWALWAGRNLPGSAASPTPIKKARSLLEILTWLIVNGLYRRSTNLLLEVQESAMTQGELRSTLDGLAAYLRTQPEDGDSLEAYARPPHVEAVALFFNLGVDAESERRDGMRLASSRSDALSYGHDRRNLVQQVDVLIFNSWQEILVQRHHGLAGLFDCLAELFRGTAIPPRLECFCFAPLRARTIVNRIRELYASMIRALPAGEIPARFVLRAGTGFFLLERDSPEGLHHRELRDAEMLYEALGEPRPRFLPLRVDDAADADLSLLATLYEWNRAGVIQVFCLPDARRVQVFILDERGSLYYRVHEALGPQRLLGPYAALLGAVLQRYVLAAGGVEYYLVERRQGEGYSVSCAGFQPNVEGPSLNVRVFAEAVDTGRIAYSIYCNEREFSSLDAAADVFAEAAAHIVTLRESGEHYGIYITDIDVPPAILGVDGQEHLQTIHFLKYKRKIEDRLNFWQSPLAAL